MMIENKMSLRLEFLVLLTLSAASVTAAQDTAPLLTLEEAIRIAEENNHQLRASDARLGAAEAAIDEARSHRLARLDLEGGYQRTDNPVLVFSNLLRQESFGAENFEVSRLNRPDPLGNWNLRLSVDQPLWAGGRIRHGETAARLHHDATGSRHERVRQEVVRQVVERYTTAVLAERQHAVARESLATAEAHVRLIRDLYEGGLVVESDLLLAQVRESEVREIVVRAESGVEVAAAALNLVLGRDLDTPFSLPPTLELKDSQDAELESLVERARESRPDLEAVRRDLEAAQARVALARSGRRPKIGFQAAWETNAEGFFGNDGDNTTLGVGFRIPLFDGFNTRARVERAREEAREIETHAELLARSADLEVRQALSELGASKQRLRLAGRSVELARRSLTIVEDRYKEGLVTLPALLDAETALTEARLRDVSARRDVLLAQAGLDLAIGEL